MAFVSSHGFGHAGRASAVLDALCARLPLEVDAFTHVPAVFLDSSLRAPHRRIPCETDVGMIQSGPFHGDLTATARAVTRFLDGIDQAAESLASELRAQGYRAVLCDISPLGIVAARRAGIPSVLIENFRWDWLYARLEKGSQALRAAARRIAEIYTHADLHLQAPPVCDPLPGAITLRRPIARAPRSSRAAARTALGLAASDRVVLVTTGGVAGPPLSTDAMRARPDVIFLLTGAERTACEGNVVHLAWDDPLYLPDVIRASDAVVAKLGYSTLAEVWREGCPMLRIPRERWPETPALSAWADAAVEGFEIPEGELRAGVWVDRVDELLAAPRRPTRRRAGQDEAAERILERGWL